MLLLLNRVTGVTFPISSFDEVVDIEGGSVSGFAFFGSLLFNFSRNVGSYFEVISFGGLRFALFGSVNNKS
jgi:hypothetical protein